MECRELSVSRYNVMGDGVVFNPITSRVARVEPRVYAAIINGRPELLLPKERDELHRAGILVHESEQAEETLRRMYERMKLGPTQALFIISPTYRCNLACSYCYEQRQNLDGRVMAPGIERRVIKFLSGYLGAQRWRSMTVKFYGGEPLIAADTCTRIIAELHEAAARNDKKLYTWFQTNGTLIRADLIRPLLSRVSVVEITIDGRRSNHDRIRATRGGQPTWERIVENIKLLSSENIPVSLRVNANDPTEIADALQELGELGIHNLPNVFLYDGQVESGFGDHVAGVRCASEWGEADGHIALVMRIRQAIQDAGWWHKYQQFPIFNTRPGICRFAKPGAFCIDPKGDLYACVFQQGSPEFRVGSIDQDGVAQLDKRYKAILSRDPFADPKCRDCSSLPVCWGGCFAQAFFREGSFSANCCGRVREALPKALSAAFAPVAGL